VTTLRAIVALLGGWRASAFALLAVLALTCAGVQTLRLSHAHAQADKIEAARAQAAEQAQKLARAAEQASAKAANDAAAAYERGKHDAEESSRQLIADLRAGTVRLRKLWEGCPAGSSGVPSTAPGAGEPDAAADDRAASAGRIVRAAAECDAQVRGLQALIHSDRSTP